MPIIAGILLAAMLLVIYFDATRFIIPNLLVGFLLLLYPIAAYLSPAPINLQADLITFAVSFVICYLMFSFNIMGGGDAKLIMALSLWVGAAHIADFIIYFALLGGLLTLLLLIARAILPSIFTAGKLPKIFRKREPVPYGLAISSSFLILLYAGQVPAASYML